MISLPVRALTKNQKFDRIIKVVLLTTKHYSLITTIMLSIFESGGKQYLVSSGDKVQVEKLEALPGATLTFDKVLYADGKVGKPFIAGATVTAKVLKQGRSAKVHVLKYKAKSKYRRKIGARQAYTEIEIVKA